MTTNKLPSDLAVTRLSNLVIESKEGELKLPFKLPVFTDAERDAIKPEHLVPGMQIFNSDVDDVQIYSVRNGDWRQVIDVPNQDPLENFDSLVTFVQSANQGENAYSAATQVTAVLDEGTVTVTFAQLRFQAPFDSDVDVSIENNSEGVVVNSDAMLPEHLWPRDEFAFNREAILVRNAVLANDAQTYGVASISNGGIFLMAGDTAQFTKDDDGNVNTVNGWNEFTITYAARV